MKTISLLFSISLCSNILPSTSDNQELQNYYSRYLHTARHIVDIHTALVQKSLISDTEMNMNTIDRFILHPYNVHRIALGMSSIITLLAIGELLRKTSDVTIFYTGLFTVIPVWATIWYFITKRVLDYDTPEYKIGQLVEPIESAIKKSDVSKVNRIKKVLEQKTDIAQIQSLIKQCNNRLA